MNTCFLDEDEAPESEVKESPSCSRDQEGNCPYGNESGTCFGYCWKEILNEFKEKKRQEAKGILKFKDSISAGEKFDYFERLWVEYTKSDYFWCIYKKDGTFCGDVQLDKDSETEYHLYIQLMDDAPIEGFGTEMFEQLIEKIVEESGAKHLEFELWNKKDRSKVIFDEIGVQLEDGEWIYDI